KVKRFSSLEKLSLKKFQQLHPKQERRIPKGFNMNNPACNAGKYNEVAGTLKGFNAFIQPFQGCNISNFLFHRVAPGVIQIKSLQDFSNYELSFRSLHHYSKNLLLFIYIYYR